MTFGPIDFIAFEFPGNKLRGEILHDLLELVDGGIIRILDLVAVQKDPDGKTTVRELQEMDPADVRIFDPLKVQVTSMVTRTDIDGIAAQLANNSTAAIMLFENLWAIKVKQAIMAADGRVVLQTRIPPDVVEEALLDIAALSSAAA